MSKIRFVASDGLPGVAATLAKGGRRVLVPVEKPAASKPSVVFAPYEPGVTMTLAKATVPPKAAVLPECETLMTFRKSRDAADLNQTTVELSATEEAQPTVVFACRTCDARGFAALDKPFLEGLYPDPYYKARRDRLTVVSLTCATGCETCFCHWVGGGPTSPIGSDVLITEIEGGYVLQAMTQAGEELLEATGLPDGADKFPLAEAARKAAWATLVPAPNLKAAQESLKAMFDDEAFWEAETARCISCGACTYFCPTCYCFNITDEGEPQSPCGGRRLRSWDNCMSSLYTREASGHNPRAEKFQRMRNRVSHKFWTYPENWGPFLCSGCGRCITNCPVCLDIRAIVLDAVAAAGSKAGA